MKTHGFLRGLILTVGLSFSLLAFQDVNSQNLIVDPGFEAGTPNPTWFEASTNFGTPICDVIACGTGTGTGPRTGNYWAWFGGIGAYEAGQVSQSVVIPPGHATLSFWLEHFIASGNNLDYLQVQIDGDVVYLLYEGQTIYYPYTQITLDISSYADGGNHTILFSSEIFGPTTSNFFVDDIELIAEPVETPFSNWVFIIVGGLVILFVIIRSRSIYF